MSTRASVALPPALRVARCSAVASLAGLMMLCWPLLLEVGPEQARATRRSSSWRCCRSSIAVVLAEVSEGGMDPRVLAVLGVLCAVNAMLRGLWRRHGRHRAGRSSC